MFKKLECYKELKWQIERLEERIVRFENSMLSPRIGNISDMPSGSHEVEHLTENLVKLDGLKTRLAKLIFERNDLQLKIEKDMSEKKLRDVEKKLIRLRYYAELPWWKIAKNLGYGQRQVFNIHKKIVKIFQKV